MNEDYLWDKSGKPDPQIQDLEQILGTLRYQPRPLKLAAALTSHRRYYLALLAIAATVLVAFVVGGLWLQARSTGASIPAVAYDVPATPVRIEELPLSPSPQPPAKRRPALAAHRNSEEAIAAKQQLMFALRLASEKLNVAYRRTQTPSQIKNQHRAGSMEQL